MQVAIHDAHGARIVECVSAITGIDHAADLVVACIQAGSRRLLLDARWLPPAFFDLSSRFAGEFLQKFENYRIRLAAVIRSEPEHSDRFREFLLEARKGRGFRVFDARPDAEVWLASE